MVMALYPIATGKWERVEECESCSPPYRLHPVVFALGETVVLCCGEDFGMWGIKDTWEWSLVTREWTETEIPPVDLTDAPGSVVGEKYHVYLDYEYSTNRPNPVHMQYCNGKWKSEQHHWNPLGKPQGFGYTSQFCVSLLREHQLLFALQRDASTPKTWLLDHVSLDRALLEPLPITEEDMLQGQRFGLVLLDARTLLLIHSRYTLIVDIDPHFLSPDCHTSTVGSDAWV
ncbi:hypothetical protein KIPB_006457 [Kipferlia bialata]|uniref:Uncharacterized protein n=1 Tax=Kipferlia bialata TaxID=797122 RepID=A0A391NWM4_9EUKA|nr:hypothetical protein KIPB_006457 [Kipferlia bialata]|eukprot:g6457.t1